MRPIWRSSTLLPCPKTPKNRTHTFNARLAYFAVAYNVVGLNCMIITLKWHHKPTLVTVGDAVKSFL